MSEPPGMPQATRPQAARLVAAWLCAVGAAATAAVLMLLITSGDVFGRNDMALSGAGLVTAVLLVVFTLAVAALLAYAAHAAWRHGHRLPAGFLGGFALVIAVIALVAEFTESAGGETSALVTWSAVSCWALALLVSASIPARSTPPSADPADRG
ncbi:hypothetical protein QEZ54_16810 [Catellatospora sp. KI3]|uniref:hypothetical protein n=1 Tax=Catellatospora sp. KI3 TaxID=3041620 RepID=UPI002482D44C|nr:hypothetical protein [Catellatospora sp. KI3]MDI1462636.1 hypothetical protein [Catellatospora sp. KI3]